MDPMGMLCHTGGNEVLLRASWITLPIIYVTGRKIFDHVRPGASQSFYAYSQPGYRQLKLQFPMTPPRVVSLQPGLHNVLPG